MGDLFDEFMRELERRRAEAEGRAPDGDPADPPDGDDDDPRPADADGAERRRRRTIATTPRTERRRGRRRRRPRRRRPRDEPTRRSAAARRPRRTSRRAAAGARRRARRPREARRPPGRRPRRRRRPAVPRARSCRAASGSRSSSSSSPSSSCSPVRHRPLDRRDLVPERRLRQRVLDPPRRPGRPVRRRPASLALVVLLGNLWLAGRLAPPARSRAAGPPPQVGGPPGRGPAPGRAERAHGAATGGPFGGVGGPGARAGRGDRRSRSTSTTCPDLVPDRHLGHRRASPCCSRIGIAGAVSGAWETAAAVDQPRAVLARPARSSDPVFGRDISFFLFDLPFFRFVQSLVNGLLLASLPWSARGTSLSRHARRRGVRHPRPRPPRGDRRAVPAVGRLRLPAGQVRARLQHRPGVATGVSFTDANARFMAYDVLTFLSGLAGALLIAGAFTRWMWPLGAVVIVWFSASLVLGRLYPEAIQRFTRRPQHVRPGGAVHREQHRDDAPRLRARRVGATDLRRARRRSPRRRSGTRRTRSPTPACGTTARCRRRWTSSRPSASTTTSSTWTRTAT